MKKESWILLGFVALKFMLQFLLLSPEYELHRDEYLHLDQANHPAFGYLSVPPVTSVISMLILLLGNGVFWVKFFPALFGALTICVVWKTIEELKGNLFALVLGATGVLFSAILRINVLYQPNSLDIFTWTTFCFVLVKFANTNHPKWLYIGALVFAVGFLNKYNFAFLLMGLFPAILITNQRRIFTMRRFYMAMCLGLLLIIPNLLWQYHHGFPVFHHLKELSETQLIHINRSDFLKEQLFLFMGSLPVIFAAMYALLFYLPFKKYRFFFWTFLLTLAIFTYLKAKGYYAIGLYPVYIAFGSVYLANILHAGWKKYLQPAIIAVVVLLFIPILMVAFPNKSPEYFQTHLEKYRNLGLLRWEDGKDHLLPQDFADMLGWKELAGKIDSICLNLSGIGQTLIFCDNYGEAGAINYYANHQELKANSLSADYVDWFDLNPEISQMIWVKEINNRDDVEKITQPLFDTVYMAGKITNEFAREKGTTIYILKNPKTDIRQFMEKLIANKKMENKSQITTHQ